jgi:hypothetical protein
MESVSQSNPFEFNLASTSPARCTKDFIAHVGDKPLEDELSRLLTLAVEGANLESIAGKRDNEEDLLPDNKPKPHE